MAEPLRIALCTRTFHGASGGLQSHTAQLAKSLRQRGHEVRVITRALSRSPGYREFFFYQDPIGAAEVEGIPVTVLRRKASWGPVLWASFKCSWRPALRPLGIRLYRTAYEPAFRAATQGCQVIHHIGQGSEMIGFAAASAARRWGVPCLIQSCIHPYQWGDSALDWALYRRADGFLTNTDFERDYFRERLPAGTPVRTTYCGVEEPIPGGGEAFRARHKVAGPMVLFLGRRDVDKGYPVLIEAFRRVQESMPGATLVCAGTNVEQVVPWTGRGRTLELGWISVEEKQQALAACDLLCVPSVGESFGMVFIEAGLHGKPVIGRNIPVLRELLGERDCGLLAGPASRTGNDVKLTGEELSETMLTLLRQPELAQRLGAQGRVRATRFLWPNLMAGYEQAYRSFLPAA